jgi:dienelactone hydrolase
MHRIFVRAVGLVVATFFASHSLSALSDEIDELRKQFVYDAKAPLNVEQKLLYEREGVKVFDLTYDSPKGGRVTGYLVLPSGKGPHAGMVFGHWGPGNKTEFLPEASLYAKAGCASVMIDYPWVRPAPWRKPLREADDPEGDHAAFVQTVIDLRRAVDLLAERKDVDPKRIGYAGHSFGAQWGAILSATEPRLKCVALLAGVPDQHCIWRDSQDPAIAAWRAATPKEKQEAYLKICEKTAAVKYVPHAKCPLFMQFAKYEQYFDKAAMERYVTAAPKGTQVTWYDTGHELNDPQALVDRAAWLKEELGLGTLPRELAP